MKTASRITDVSHKAVRHKLNGVTGTDLAKETVKFPQDVE